MVFLYYRGLSSLCLGVPNPLTNLGQVVIYSPRGRPNPTLAAGALSQARSILSGLNVDPERMPANLDLARGLVVSEAVMMGLAPYLGRERAHDLVYDICREVSAGNGTFLDLLAGHPEIKPHLGRDALAALLDPANYLGMASQMVDCVLEINGKANQKEREVMMTVQENDNGEKRKV